MSYFDNNIYIGYDKYNEKFYYISYKKKYIVKTIKLLDYYFIYDNNIKILMGVYVKNTFIHIEPMFQLWEFIDNTTTMMIGLPTNKLSWKVIRTIP